MAPVPEEKGPCHWSPSQRPNPTHFVVSQQELHKVHHHQMQRSSKSSGHDGDDEDESEKQASQEAIDRVIAIDVAREDQKSKMLRPPTVADEELGIVVQRSPSRFQTTTTTTTMAKPPPPPIAAARLESRLLREGQKSTTVAPAQVGVVHKVLTPGVAVAAAAAGTTGRVQQREAFIPEVLAPSIPRFTLQRGKSEQSDVSDLTSITGYTTMKKPPAPTLRPAHSHGSSGDGGHGLTTAWRERGLFAFKPKDDEQLVRLATTMEEKEPTAREVAMSLLFSDEELEEAKARVRWERPNNWTTAAPVALLLSSSEEEEYTKRNSIERSPSPRRRRSVAAVATAAGLHPSHFLDELIRERRRQTTRKTTTTTTACHTVHGVVDDDDTELPTTGTEQRFNKRPDVERKMPPSARPPAGPFVGVGSYHQTPSNDSTTFEQSSNERNNFSSNNINNTKYSNPRSVHSTNRLRRASAIVQSAARKVQRAQLRRKSTGSDDALHIAEVLFGDNDEEEQVKDPSGKPAIQSSAVTRAVARAASRNQGAVLAPAPPHRCLTGSVLLCREDVELVEASLSDIDINSSDHKDTSADSDAGDETYALAVARINLARKLAKENVGDQMPPHQHEQQDWSTSASALVVDNTRECSSHDGDGDGDNANELPQILSRPGAFAINRVRNADSISQDSFFSLNTSSDGLAIYDREIRRPHHSVVSAEVYEEDEAYVVDGNIVREKEEELIDPKTKRRLRIMTTIIIGLIIGAIALLTGTLANFTPGSDETVNSVPATVTGWSLVGKGIFGAAEEPRTWFGTSIRMNQDGTRLVATSPGTDDGTNLNVGKVYVLDYSNDVDRGAIWTEAYVLSGHGHSEEAAMSLAASSDAKTLAIGYPRLETDRGVVDIITETQPGKWSNIKQFKAEDFAVSDKSWFGHSVDLSNNATVISISSPLQQLDDGRAVGAVHVFQAGANKGEWSRKGKALVGDTPMALFGWSTDLSGNGDVLAIGAPATDNAKGLVCVFRWDSSAWTKLGQDFVGEIPFNRLGESVSLSYDGTLLAIGSRWLATETGLVHLYQFNASNNKWDVAAVITGHEPGEGFGSSVDLSDSGTTLAIGAPQSSYFGPDSSGRVEVRVQNKQSGVWELSGGFIGNASLQEFGASVAISEVGDIVASGAPNTNYDAKIIRAGSVQVYERQQQ